MKILWPLMILSLLVSGCGFRHPTAPVAEPPQVEPQTTPTPAPEMPDPLRETAAGMELRELVGQLFFIRPDSLDLDILQADVNNSRDPNGVTSVTPKMEETLGLYPVGGVVLFEKNIVEPDQLAAFTAQLQRVSRYPLLIAADEEGRAVSRLAANRAFGIPTLPTAQELGERGADAARETGAYMGAYLRQYGLNMDFAPVADVFTNPRNPVIGKRAFSTDGGEAAAVSGAFAQGLASQGVIPTLKHFPGHGDTGQDSHDGVAVCARTEPELLACEWLPYTQNDLTGWAVMVGHIALPAVTGENTPATLSREIVTGLLRERLGFRGLVITDSLAMDAVTGLAAPGEAAVRALEAGCDMLLMPNGLVSAFDGVMEAVESGRLSRERLEESVVRILMYKQMLGLL